MKIPLDMLDKQISHGIPLTNEISSVLTCFRRTQQTNSHVAFFRDSFIIISNKTRQGYALRSTLKPAGYFFSGGGHAL